MKPDVGGHFSAKGLCALGEDAAKTLAALKKSKRLFHCA